MNKSIVLPVCGKSTRYPGTKPKWMYDHPDGYSMLTMAIKGIVQHSFDKILVIGISDHKKYIEKVITEIKEKYSIEVLPVFLDKQTKSAPETIYKGLKKADLGNEGILIKDSDGYYEYKDSVDWSKNHVAVADLHDTGRIHAANKSYVQVDENNVVGNIIEKQVTGNLFCVGGYFFKNSDDFIDVFESIDNTGGNDELYVSHIIYKMLLNQEMFFIERTKEFEDWGTIEDWIAYLRKKANQKAIVIDVDNTLCETDKAVPYKEREPIKSVIDKLRWYKKQGFYVIIETGRQMKTYQANQGLINKHTLPVLIDWLQKQNIPYDEIRIGKPWQGEQGFRVDDDTIRPREFLDLSYKQIQSKLKEDRV